MTIGVSSESNAKSFFLDSESQHKFWTVAAIRSLLISHVDTNIEVTRLMIDPFRSRITFLPMGCLEIGIKRLQLDHAPLEAFRRLITARVFECKTLPMVCLLEKERAHRLLLS